MKSQLKWVVVGTGLCLAAATGFAQADYGSTRTSNDTNQTTNARETTRSQQFFHAKDIVGASVKDSQGQKIGDIHDVIFNPQNGEAFAAINVGHSTYALVPTQALEVTPSTKLLSRKADVMVNTTKETLESGPTIQNDEWDKLDTSSFTQSIYTHYKLQAPSAMGGVGASSFGGTSKGAEQGTNTWNKPSSERR